MSAQRQAELNVGGRLLAGVALLFILLFGAATLVAHILERDGGLSTSTAAEAPERPDAQGPVPLTASSLPTMDTNAEPAPHDPQSNPEWIASDWDAHRSMQLQHFRDEWVQKRGAGDVDTLTLDEESIRRLEESEVIIH